MLGFWIIAATAAFVTIAIIGRALLVGRGGADDAATYDIQVYRDQLKELDRDVARGVIAETEAERARVEISRRLLEADRKSQTRRVAQAAPPAATWTALALAAVVVVGGGYWLYSTLGAPGTPDLPLEIRIANAEELRATRATQAELEADLPHWSGPPPEAPADYLDLVDKLRAALADRPGDLQGQQLLAQHEAALGNYRAAHQALARTLELLGSDAGADDFTKYADLLVLAAHGRVSPEAETAIKLALELNPKDPIALYYLGLMYGQTDRPDVAFRIWRDLLESSHPGESWVEPIRGQIGQLAAMAGVDYTPPVAAAAPFAGSLAGPSADDMDAAAEMSPEDRAAMVAGMVERLMERLATQGGTAEEWAQLIGALGIMGDADRARGIWGEAQQVFAAEPEGLALIDAAATGAGLGDPIPFDPDAAPDTAPTPAPETAPTTDALPADDPHGADAVATLMARLADDGGTPAEWAQLIGALGVQGDTERARVIWGEAQTVFAPYPEAVAMIDAAAKRAGLSAPIDFSAQPPSLPTLSGPTAEMSPEDRAAMVDGMATRLADELATNGGPPEKWIQLLNALGTLGETERTAAAYAEAQKFFADDPAGLAELRAAAEALGVVE